MVIKNKILIPTISFNNMQCSENVIVLGAGRSLDKDIKQVIKWEKNNRAIVIGAHYRYLSDQAYMVFSAPKKIRRFIKSKKEISSCNYLISSRIFKENIPSRWYGKTIQYQFNGINKKDKANYVFSDFISTDNKIMRCGCGYEAIILSTFCRPKNLLLAGFDGYERDKKRRVVVRHASDILGAYKPPLKTVYTSKKRNRNQMKTEVKTHNFLHYLFNWLSSFGIKVYISTNCKLHKIDRDILREKTSVCFLE